MIKLRAVVFLFQNASVAERLHNLLMKVQISVFFKPCQYCMSEDYLLILFIFSQKSAILYRVSHIEMCDCKWF